MASAGPMLTAKLSLDMAAFERGMTRAVSAARTSASKMVAYFAGIGSASGFVLGIKNAYEYARSLEILSRNTGFSTKSMSVFKVAMEDTGVSMELFQRTSRMIAKEVMLGMHGDQAATAGMEQIGLHVRDLIKLNPEQQFMAVGNAIASLKSPTLQAAAAVSRFGSESAKMLSFFKNKEALANAAEAVGKQAEIFERSGKTMEKIAVRIGHIKVKAMGFFLGTAESIMPMVDKFSAMFNKADFTAWGAKLGAAINKATAWLVTFWREPAKTAAYFWEYAKVEAMELGNLLVDAGERFGESLVAGVVKAMAVLNPWNDMQNAVARAAGIAPPKVDHMGAGNARARLAAMRPNDAFNQARADLGQNLPTPAGMDITTPWRLRGFHGTGGLLGKGEKFSGLMQGASMGGYLKEREDQLSQGMDGTGSLSHMRQGAYGQSNLLKHGELRRFRNMKVAMGLISRAPGETANGDRQRAKAVARELERKKQHAGSSEQLLSDIATYTDEVAKNTRPFVR